MSHHVTVFFSEASEFEFLVSEAELATQAKDQARAWFSQQFEDLECTPSNPMGKVLVLDMILNVAKYGGEARFAEGGDWARTFARCAAATLDRPAIKVDVANFVVG